MKHNFKVGDKVFDYRYGWMIIISSENKNNENSKDHVCTIINNSNKYIHYYNEDIKALSFTEYTLDGYSNEIPIEEFKIGYFWDDDDFSACIYSKLIKIHPNSDYKYESLSENRYEKFSLTPPEIKW